MKTKPDEIAAQRRASLTRRTFLRGLGACIALPSLESLKPLGVLASPTMDAAGAASKAAPTRMCFIYVPNGTIPDAWWPAGEGGADFELPRTLKPLENVRN